MDDPNGSPSALSGKRRLSREDVAFLWEAAASHDDSLAVRPAMIHSLVNKQVKPATYTRARLYERMAACAPSLFSNFELRRNMLRTVPPADAPTLSALLSRALAGESARVRSGGFIRRAPLPDVMARWNRGRSIFGVTDLHCIGTRFDRVVDTAGLNEFNLLPRGTEGFQSQDSLVISSKGAVTDSHSDDHSGSNHSFIGQQALAAVGHPGRHRPRFAGCRAL